MHDAREGDQLAWLEAGRALLQPGDATRRALVPAPALRRRKRLSHLGRAASGTSIGSGFRRDRRVAGHDDAPGGAATAPGTVSANTSARTPASASARRTATRLRRSKLAELEAVLGRAIATLPDRHQAPPSLPQRRRARSTGRSVPLSASLSASGRPGRARSIGSGSTPTCRACAPPPDVNNSYHPARAGGRGMPCQITLYSVNGIVGPGQANPTVLRVAGKAILPVGTEVEITSSLTGNETKTGPVGLDPNLEFRVDLPITASPAPACGSQQWVKGGVRRLAGVLPPNTHTAAEVLRVHHAVLRRGDAARFHQADTHQGQGHPPRLAGPPTRSSSRRP